MAGYDVGEVLTSEIRDSQFAENIIQDTGCVLDGIISDHQTGRLESRESEGIDELFQRHAILQSDGNRDGKIVHERTEGGTLFVHVDENFPGPAILVFASAQVN